MNNLKSLDNQARLPKITEINFTTFFRNLAIIIDHETDLKPEYIIYFQSYYRRDINSLPGFKDMLEDRPGHITFHHMIKNKRLYSNHLLIRTDVSALDKISLHKKIIIIRGTVFFDAQLFVRITGGIFRLNEIKGPIELPVGFIDYESMMASKNIDFSKS